MRFVLGKTKSYIKRPKVEWDMSWSCLTNPMEKFTPVHTYGMYIAGYHTLGRHVMCKF